MPRPRKVAPTTDLHVVLPAELLGRLHVHLYSEAEQRLPFGAMQKFFTRLLQDFFGRQGLDLGTYFADLPPGSRIYGPPAVVEALKNVLEAQ